MSAYIRQDRLDQEYQEAAWREDLLIERLSGEILDDPLIIASAISDLDEDSKTTKRLADALHQFYHDSSVLTPSAMLLRSALYGVIKKHCQSVMEKF